MKDRKQLQDMVRRLGPDAALALLKEVIAVERQAIETGISSLKVIQTRAS